MDAPGDVRLRAVPPLPGPPSGRVVRVRRLPAGGRTADDGQRREWRTAVKGGLIVLVMMGKEWERFSDDLICYRSDPFDFYLTTF